VIISTDLSEISQSAKDFKESKISGSEKHGITTIIPVFLLDFSKIRIGRL
jgi:hypothetical protein